MRDAGNLRNKASLGTMRRALNAGAERDGFRLAYFSIQRDHLHLIVEAKDKDALSRGLRAIQIRIARAMNRLLERSGRFFADRYHAHVLKTPTEVRRALSYVLLNGRRHAHQQGRSFPAGLVDFYSSAIYFDGWCKPVQLSRPHDDRLRPVTDAKTWLLKVGWRHRGLLSPDAIPGMNARR